MTSRRRNSSGAADKRDVRQHETNRKIQEHHRERLAVVYVRQSSQRQVEEHRESAELQYGLTKRAEKYGWPQDRILVIDEDQGQSGRTAGKSYTRHTVRKLLDLWGLTEPQRPLISAKLSTLGANEWWLLDLSCRLSIDRSTLARWCRRGWVHGRQLPGQRRWWIIWADEDECDRLRKLYEHGRGWPHHNGSPYPEELNRPKRKP